MMYDIIIVGSGIAGLNLYNRLLEEHKYKNILLIDKNGYIGGRIYTISVKLNGVTHKLEAGGARFNDNHKRLLSMINKFQLNNQIIKINSSNLDFLPRKNKWKNNPVTNKLPYDYLDEILKHNKLNKNMAKYTFKEWLYKNISKEVADYIVDSYPYKDMFKTNAYDALRLYKGSLNINQNFYILKNGLSNLVKNLKKNIQYMGGKILLNTECKDITYNKGIYSLSCLSKDETPIELLSKKVVLTIQQPQLKQLKIFNPVRYLLNSVDTSVLLRIYFIFKVPKSGVWFKNCKKTLTDSKLTYFIPINYNNGSVMISYSDEHTARFLNDLEKKDKNKFISFIIDECKSVFNIKTIPKPIWNKSCYWENGVGKWKKNIDSTKASKQIIRPFKRKPLFICGENYSKDYQAWIEGSLETSDKVFKLL